MSDDEFREFALYRQVGPSNTLRLDSAIGVPNGFSASTSPWNFILAFPTPLSRRAPEPGLKVTWKNGRTRS